MGCGTGTYANFGLDLTCATGQVLTNFNRLPDPTVNALPFRPTEYGAGAEQCQRIILGTSIVDCNVPKHVFVDLLGQVDIDAEEVS